MSLLRERKKAEGHLEMHSVSSTRSMGGRREGGRREGRRREDGRGPASVVWDSRA